MTWTELRSQMLLILVWLVLSALIFGLVTAVVAIIQWFFAGDLT